MQFKKKEKPLLKILNKNLINKRYLSWLNNKDNQKKIDLQKKISINELKKYFRENKKKGNKLHAIFYKKKHIGNINIRFLTKNKCYVGFLIGDKKNKSRGIGTYSVNSAIEKCFKIYEVNEVYSSSQLSNKASLSVLRKNNFKPLKSRPKYFTKYIKNIPVKYFILKRKNFKRLEFIQKI